MRLQRLLRALRVAYIHRSGFNDSIHPSGLVSRAPQMPCTCGPDMACSSCPPAIPSDKEGRPDA